MAFRGGLSAKSVRIRGPLLYRSDMSGVLGPAAVAGRVPLSPLRWAQNVAPGRRSAAMFRLQLSSSVTAGTIFQDTRKPLTLWFRAMWAVTSQKNGASAIGLQRVLGLGSYKTAWTWLHKLRRAMVRPGRDRLSGCVEVNETFDGGEEPGVRGGKPRISP
jgi:hypothetical protein